MLSRLARIPIFRSITSLSRSSPIYNSLCVNRNSIMTKMFEQTRNFHCTPMRRTTVLCVRKNGEVAIMADGQVTRGASVAKGNARKLRPIGDGVIAGFAGSTADAISLYEKLEAKLEQFPNQLTRACVELAKDWRSDKMLRHLDAIMIVADGKVTLTLSGNGDVLEPPSGVLGIGSGGDYAYAAATALMSFDELSAEQVAERSMKIAADICIYTNGNFTKIKLGKDGKIVKDEILTATTNTIATPTPVKDINKQV